ncbi:MAG TPA: hypothetical protein VKQ27_08795 [Acetobacteraceae bacterium]|nr:hypothetical protein [Acetobacteraceae bacterium]
MSAPFFDAVRLTKPLFVPGIRLVASDVMTVLFEDWSGVRSPSRARRRRARGHRQNIRFRQIADPKMIQGPDGTLYGHPHTIARVERELAAEMKRRSQSMREHAVTSALMGRNPW